MAYHRRLIMQHPGSLTVPVSGRQGGQLSTKSLAEDEMWSGFRPQGLVGGMCVPWWHWRRACHRGWVARTYFRWKPGDFSWDVEVCWRHREGREKETPWALPQPGWVTSGQGKMTPRALKRRPYFCSEQNSSIRLVIMFQQVIFFFFLLVRLSLQQATFPVACGGSGWE